MPLNDPASPPRPAVPVAAAGQDVQGLRNTKAEARTTGAPMTPTTSLALVGVSLALMVARAFVGRRK